MKSLYDVPAPAKLNLFLHIVGRRADGKLETQTDRKIFTNAVDPWAAECRMR